MSELDTQIAPNKTTTEDEALTEYILLSMIDNGMSAATWMVEGSRRERSGDAAIRRLLNGKDDVAGTYVAVPARSWRPVSVKAEQTTVLRLETT